MTAKEEYLETLCHNLIKTADTLKHFGITTTFESHQHERYARFLISTTAQLLDVL